MAQDGLGWGNRMSLGTLIMQIFRRVEEWTWLFDGDELIRLAGLARGLTD